MMELSKGEVLHIFVIGFHHKKGCQIEFSYPEIESLPDEWRNLPSLAMPDGAHNYDHDAVYFSLPSLNHNGNTVFGISCFQQIPIERVKKRTNDMTRGTVQKAICILSTLPLFGYIQIKMELVTAAFFDEGDFSNVTLLKDAFHHLNDCLSNSYSQHLYDGLSVRDLVLKFRHRTLLLFKLLLLERRVVFFNTPVKPMCCTMLSLISLHPGMIERGLFKSFSTKKTCLSPEEGTEFSGVDQGKILNQNLEDDCNETEDADKVEDESNDAPSHIPHDNEPETLDNADEKVDEDPNDCVGDCLIEEYFDEMKTVGNSEDECPALSADVDLLPSGIANVNQDISYLQNLNLENFGFPLSIFTEGNLFLPYISIGYLDFLTCTEVKGFHGGAANLLFKQKKQIIDVLVELESSRIETSCPELRRQLFLTTEDLRFGERLMRGVLDPNTCRAECSGNCSIEDWIRMQFTLYMISLLRTSLMEDGSRELDHFNVHFVNAWKNTNNYQMWMSQGNKAIFDLTPGHPYAGNLSVSDVRLRFSQAMTSTESGRRINQAVTSTGKVVGGAIIQARGALSQWWSSLTTQDGKPTRAINNI